MTPRLHVKYEDLTFTCQVFTLACHRLLVETIQQVSPALGLVYRPKSYFEFATSWATQDSCHHRVIGMALEQDSPAPSPLYRLESYPA